jgi:hypothetical protein
MKTLAIVLGLLGVLAAPAGAALRRSRADCHLNCQPAVTAACQRELCDTAHPRRGRRCQRVAGRKLLRQCRQGTPGICPPIPCPACPASNAGAFVDPCAAYGFPPPTVDACAAACSAEALGRCQPKGIGGIGKESRCVSVLLRRLLPACRQGRHVCHA